MPPRQSVAFRYPVQKYGNAKRETRNPAPET